MLILLLFFLAAIFFMGVTVGWIIGWIMGQRRKPPVGFPIEQPRP